jgi:glyoxylase-like metal-dependent hydrolase (beta-lactamase superfamily II)
LDGLKTLQISPNEIDYIILTHIHLDHAGGAGQLLEHCQQAKVIVHPKGARHLIDPSRLILGAKQVYGDKFEKLFDPISPIPEGRIITMEDSNTISLGKNCTLTFLDTPGHANHHFSIYDSATNGFYTGDTIGVSYEEVIGHPFFLPSTSPNQFNPKAMLHSIERIEEYNPSYIFFGHYGESAHTKKVFEQIRYWIPIFIEAAEHVVQRSLQEGHNSMVELLSNQLYERVLDYLNGEMNDELYTMIQLDLQVSSMGLLDYLSKK